LITTEHHSLIGTLTLAADETGLRHIIFPSGSRAFEAPENWSVNSAGFSQIRQELDEYFAGKRRQFSIRISPAGTVFQQSVWKALQEIDYANTCSYGDIALKIGKPSASRAVGAANRANPIPIIVPCHRVIGASGKLTGFGGGLHTKAWLLSHERGEVQMFEFTSPASDQKSLA